MVRVSTESPSTSYVCWRIGIAFIFYELHEFCMAIYYIPFSVAVE